MEIVNKEISKESEAKVSFKDAKISVEFSYEGKGAGVKIVGYVGVDYFLDELKKAIPGQIDDAVIDVLKLALKAV